MTTHPDPRDVLKEIAQEMRDRRVNHGKDTSPTLERWADRIDAALCVALAGKESQELFEAADAMFMNYRFGTGERPLRSLFEPGVLRRLQDALDAYKASTQSKERP